jgi:hypothetical protein
MPVWLYHGRPTRMAFHDLTTRLEPPKNLRSLLGLNLKFVPNPRRNVPWATSERDILPRFDRDFESIFSWQAWKLIPRTRTIQRCTLRQTGCPPNLFTPVDLRERLSAFKAALKSQYKTRRFRNNFVPHQQRALNSLRNQDDFLIVQRDKNLGPAIIEKEEHIQLALIHLTNNTTYRRLSPLEATMYSGQI